jgi:hypothetical protein
LGIAAIPITAALPAVTQQIKVTPNIFDLPATIDNNGMITKTNTIFVTNYGLYDINSILVVTNVLNESLHIYGQPTINLWYVPHGSMMPLFIVTRVNLTALNESGTIGNFLNTSSFLSQNIMDVRYAYSLVGFSTMLITPIGALSPMSNLLTGPAVRDSGDDKNATVPFIFLNFIQGYNLHIEAELYNKTGPPLVASGFGDYSAPSATFFMPGLFLGNITVSSSSTIPLGNNYELHLKVTIPFDYMFVNSTFSVV